MNNTKRLFRAPKAALPSELLNLFIEVDNQSGRRGLDRLEDEFRQAERLLRRRRHPRAADLNLWLRALAAYRETYYPSRPSWRNPLGRRAPRQNPRLARQTAG